MPGFERIRRRRFVAIATATFGRDEARYPALDGVSGEVMLITGWLTDEKLGSRRFKHEYQELKDNPSYQQIERRFRNPPGEDRWNRSDAAVIYITGHGDVYREFGPPEHYTVLSQTDGTDLPGTGFRTAQLLRWLASTDIDYLIVIIDLCFAGHVVQELAGAARDHWLILPSAQQGQRAQVGALAKAIRGYLRDAAQYNRSTPYLQVGSFVRELNGYLPPDQKVTAVYKGASHDQHAGLPNPAYEADDDLARTEPPRQALALPVDVFPVHNRVGRRLPAAGSPGWLFTGRRRLMRDLIAAAAEPGATMITGSAGSGKSLALARLVTLSDPEFRRRYAQELAGVPADMLPPPGAVSVAVSARGLSAREVIIQICSDLGAEMPSGRWEDPVRANREALDDFLAKSAEQVTIVLDALDEAADPADLVRSVLVPLCQRHPRRLCLLAGVRSPEGGEPDASGALLADLMATAANARRIQADDDLRWDTGDLVAFVRNLLTNTPGSPYWGADSEAVADVIRVIAGFSGHSYLVARVAASSVASRPALTRSDDQAWLAELRGGLFGAFRGDLHTSLPAAEDRRRGVALLRAVAFARGAGLPWRLVWPRVATAVDSIDGNGQEYGDGDIRWLLGSRLNAYLVTDRQDGLSVYRLVHDELRDILRSRWRELLEQPRQRQAAGAAPPPAGDDEIREVEARIARRLRAEADVQPTIGVTEAVPPYIRRHFAEHALAGGVLEEYLPVPFLPYLDLARLRAAVGASPDRRQLEESVPWLPVVRRVAHLWDWSRPAANAAAVEMEAALSECRLPGPARDPWPVGGPWRVQWAVQPPDMGSVLGHHGGAVWTVAMAELSGGPVAVTGGDDGLLHVWDLSTGARYRDREPVDTRAGGARSPAIRSVATARLPRHGTVAVTGSADGTLRVWHLESGRAIGTALDAGAEIAATATAQLPDGRAVVIAADVAGTIRTWELDGGAQVGRPVHCGPGMALGISTALVDGQAVGVATGTDSGLLAWDVSTGMPRGARLTGHSRAVQPDTGTIQGGRVIATVALAGQPVALTGNGDGLLLWDLRAHAQIARRLTGGDGAIRSLATTRLGERVIAVTGASSTLQVLDVTTGETIGEPLTGHEGSVEATAVARTPDGAALAVSGSRDKSVRMWDVLSGARSRARPARHVGTVEAVATAGARPLAVTCSDITVHVWDLERGGEAALLTGHDSPLVSVACAESPDGLLVAAGHWDGFLSVWRAADGAVVSQVRVGDIGAAAALAMAALPGGRLVAVAGGWDGSVRAWDPLAGAALGEPVPGHADVVVSVVTATTADGRVLVASGGKEGVVRIADLGDQPGPGGPGARHAVAATTGRGIASLAVAAMDDGRCCVVAGGADGTVQLLDISDGSLAGPSWRACPGAVAAVAAGRLPGGRAAVFTGGAQARVQAWDAGTGRAAGEALPVAGPVLAMAFHPGLSSLVVGGRGVAVARPRHNRDSGLPG